MKGKWQIAWTDGWEGKKTNKLPHEQVLRIMFEKLVK